MNARELIWNRAAINGGGFSPGPGDAALAALLRAHGLVMNGGVLHAVETLPEDLLLAAQAGYRFFGFAATAALLMHARILINQEMNLDNEEYALDRVYESISNDSLIFERFAEHLQSHLNDFSPP